MYFWKTCRPAWRLLRLIVGTIILAGQAGCVTTSHLDSTLAQAPKFDAVAFFENRTEGKGVLKIVGRRSEPTLVEGLGRVTIEHAIDLYQSVKRGNRLATHRQWHLRPDGAGGYIGTLTDAVGPVLGTVDGNRLHIVFLLKGRLKADQWLYLDKGGMIAHNIMIIRKLGMPVARLDETITRISPQQ
jgi:hypothetical protein